MLGFWREKLENGEGKGEGGKGKRNVYSPSSIFHSPSSIGQVTVETTFFILFFVIMFFGAFELGRALSIKHSMDVGCFKAARYLSFSTSEVATAGQMVRDEVDNNLLAGGYGTQITVTISFPLGTDFQDPLTVGAALDYQALIPLLPLPGVTLRAQHSQRIEEYP